MSSLACCPANCLSHCEEFNKLTDEQQRFDRLCEMNVMEQMNNLSQTMVVQNAWGRGQELAIHGFIYSVNDGILRDMGIHLDAEEQ